LTAADFGRSIEKYFTMMKASEYRAICPYCNDCDGNICSPWGFSHTKSHNVNGKTLMIVGLNTNDSSLNMGNPSRVEYSDYLKGLIREEIKNILSFKVVINLQISSHISHKMSSLSKTILCQRLTLLTI